MRIGLVSEYYSPFVPGGAEQSTQLLAQELARRSDVERVVVITPNHGTAPANEVADAQGKLIIERYPFPFKLGDEQLQRFLWMANPLSYAYMAQRTLQMVRKHKLSVVHAQNKQSLVGTVWAARWAKIPAVATVRDPLVFCRYGMCLNEFNDHPEGCDLASYLQCLRDYQAVYMPEASASRRARSWLMAWYFRLDNLLKKRMLQRTDAVVTISDKMGEITRSRQVHPPRMVTIYNSIPSYRAQSEVTHTSGDKWKLFFAGRLTHGKGAQRLVEAMPAVCAALAPKAVQLQVAGEGPLLSALTARAEELGVGEAVTFLGSVPGSKMQEYYANADVVVVPSVWQEAFGRVALEALVSGTPVVASTHGGLGEIVEDGITGEVVDPDPAQLAEAIVSVLQDATGFRQRVREALPRLQDKFGSDIGERHVALYRELLGTMDATIDATGSKQRGRA